MLKSGADSTASTPEKPLYKSDDTSPARISGTAPGTLDFSETVAREEPNLSGDEISSLDTALQTPLPSKPPFTVRGKTVTSWSIERRRTAKSLHKNWRAAAKHIGTSAFAVYVSRIVTDIDEVMPNFRGIPHEDAFAGVLQLIQSSLTGRNFSHLQATNLTDLFDAVFSTLANTEQIDLSLYNSTLQRLLDNGFLCDGK